MQQLLGGVHRPDDFSKMTKNFTLFGGKRFDGLGGAIKAVTWLEGCEEAFSKMEISTIQKREMATQMLDGAALHWWRAIRAGLDLLAFGWDEFLLRFWEKFIPYSERNALADFFIHLRQGGLSVTQLINRFNELSQFAPHMVATDEMKVERLLQCLHPQLSLSCQYAYGQSFAYTICSPLRGSWES